MSAKKTKTPKPAAKAAPDESPARWVSATGSKDPAVQEVRLGEVLSSLFLPAELSKEEQAKRLNAAIEALKDIAPKDGQEGMLAAQMVATHSVAMECLRRAMIPTQSFAGFEQSLKHANKLLQTYARQLEVLDKHRGKGQQKITVEHVTVEAGGQAIVGNVTAAPAARPAQEGAAPMLAHQPAEFMPLIKDITPAKAPVKARRTVPGPQDPE